MTITPRFRREELRQPRRGGTAVAVTAVLAAIPIPIAETAAVAITETESAIVTLTVAIDLAHHRGWTFLVLVHTHGDVAQHVLAEPFLALDLVESRRRCVDVEQCEMRLAVLPQTIGEGLHAPLLGLDDLASHLLENAGELGGKLFDLLRAGILARQEDVFIEGHRYAFPCVMLPRREALRTLSGKARMLRRREHGTPDHQALPHGWLPMRPSVQLPAGIERKRGL